MPYCKLALPKSRIALAIAFAALLVFAGCGRAKKQVDGPLVICSGYDAGVRPNASRFGTFDPNMYLGYESCIDSLSRALGARPGYFLWFQFINDPFPASVVAANAARSAETVISLALSSSTADSSRNDTLLREITLGRWDSTLSAFANAAIRSGVVVYLRFGYEMNGNWFAWGQKKELFVAAWLHAHALFARLGATKVRWIFAPGIIWDGLTVRDDILPYYPGDSVVDAVGLDGYNFGDHYDQWHHWQSFREVFETSLRGVADLGKPIWITEIGCPTDQRRPAWLDDMLAFMDDNPCVEALLWFNAHKDGEPDFRLQSDSASLAKMRAWLGK